MRNLEDDDDHYRKILKEKLHTIDSAGLIHVYRKELSDKLLVGWPGTQHNLPNRTAILL